MSTEAFVPGTPIAVPPKNRKTPEQRAQEAAAKAEVKALKQRQLLDRRLQYISRLHRSEYENRRKFEWRTLTAALATYVAASIGATRLAGHKPGIYVMAVLGVGIVIVAKMAISYLSSIHERNLFNKKLAEAAERCLIDATHERSVIDASKPNFISHDWSLAWQRRAICLGAGMSLAYLFALAFEA